MLTENLLSHITARPTIFGGKPIIRDMRISVELILSLLRHHNQPDEEWPVQVAALLPVPGTCR